MNFWDTSAIVPLLVHQPSSQEMTGLYASSPANAIWTLTSVEVISALCRLEREGRLGHRYLKSAEDQFLKLKETCMVIKDVGSVQRSAERLLRLHPLKAADALQLAAALCVLDNSGGLKSSFVTLDTRLAEAASKEGLRVLPNP